MASAFDWSPGGCCCGPKGWYDLYTGVDQSQYTRRTSIRRIGKPENSLDGNDWFVQPSITPGPQVTGWAAVDDAVFVRSGLGCMDAVAKTMRYDKTATQLFPGTAPDANMQAASAIGCGVVSRPTGGFSQASLYNVSLSGNATNWGKLSNASPPYTWGGPRIFGFGTIISWEYSIEFFAPLGWPKVAGCRRPATGTGPSFVEFFVADLKAGVDHPELDNIQVIKTSLVSEPNTYIVGRWVSFDWYGNHWAGTITYDNAPYNNPNRKTIHEFRIDGQIISSVETQLPAAVPDPLNLGTPRVGQRADKIAVIRGEYPDQFSGSFMLSIFNADGTLVWDSLPMLSAAEQVYGSSDRWIYLRLSGGMNPTLMNQFTGGVFTGVIGPQNEPFREFIVNYDGTELVPCGELSNTFHTMVSRRVEIQPHAIVRDSEFMPDTLPPTYQEMYDRRNE